jgi:hypothetical protein
MCLPAKLVSQNVLLSSQTLKISTEIGEIFHVFRKFWQFFQNFLENWQEKLKKLSTFHQHELNANKEKKYYYEIFENGESQQNDTSVVSLWRTLFIHSVYVGVALTRTGHKVKTQ